MKSLITHTQRTIHTRSFSITPSSFKPDQQSSHLINNIGKSDSFKLSQKLSRQLPYDETQQKRLDLIKADNAKFGPLGKHFKDLGYFSIDDHKLTEIDLKRVKNELLSLERQEEVNTEPIQQPFKRISTTEFERPTRSKTQSYRMSTLYDFIHHLQTQIGYFDQSISSQFKRRFEYLENAVYAPNTLNAKGEPIKFISLDFKSKNNELREIGLSIYTPPKPVDLDYKKPENEHEFEPSKEQLSKSYLSTPPDIKTYHIIVEEYFGVLSKNHYKESPSLKLPLREAIKFVKSTLEQHLSLDDHTTTAMASAVAAGEGAIGNNKLVGYNTGNILKMLTQLEIVLPMNPDSVIDIMNLYMTPFLYKNSPVNLQQQQQHDEYLRILPFFMKFESIVNRFNLIPDAKKSDLDLSNPANKSRYELLILHKLVNPYVRLDFKLDDFKENWSFMKRYLDQQINLILGKSSSNTSLNNKQLSAREEAIMKSIDRTTKLIRDLELKANNNINHNGNIQKKRVSKVQNNNNNNNNMPDDNAFMTTNKSADSTSEDVTQSNN